jgi:VanZ like protein
LVPIPQSLGRRLGYLLTIAGLLLIAGATLVPLPRQAAASQATPIWCLVCGEYGGVDVLANVLLFIPAGVGLGLTGLSPRKAALVGFGVSLVVETLQLTLIPGRDASLSDLLTNTVGAAIGAGLGSRPARFLAAGSRQAARFALLAGLNWLGVQSGTAFLLQPWAPAEPLRGAWARIRPGRTPFDGTVSSALVSRTVVRDGSPPADPGLRDRLTTGEVHLALSLISGRNAPDWSPVFELRARHGTVLGVEGTGKDLVFQAPARSYSLRLRRPMLLIPNALPTEAGKSLQLECGEARGALWATWTAPDGRHHSFQPLTPSLGWSLILPVDYTYRPGVRVLTALWVAGLLFPVGYWSGGSGRGRAAILWASGLLAVGLGLVPLLGGYPSVHWSEWLAGAGGLGAGWVSHRAAAYLGGRCVSPSIKESC